MFKKIEENVTDEQRNWKCKKTQMERPQMKNTVSEMKNILGKINGGFDSTEKKSVETTQSEIEKTEMNK